jgi:small-conductance mechanosensitive channel
MIISELAIALYIVVVSFVLAKLVRRILMIYVHKLVSKTETTLDDELLKVLTRPFYIYMVSFGLEVALLRLIDIERYELWTTNGFFVLYVLLTALVISRVLKVMLSHWLTTQKNYEKTPMLLGKVVAVIVYVIAILIILGHFNVQISPIIATLGVGGLAVGLALQGTLANLFGGLHLISDKPIKVGDFVDIGTDMAGYVEDIGWRTTRLRKLSNTYVIIPNAKLADSTIINHSLPTTETSFGVECGVAYTEDLDKVEKITLKVAKQIQKTIEGCVADYEPSLSFNKFGDSNIMFNVFFKVEAFPNKFLVTHEFIKALKRAYDKEGIEISMPARKIIKG